MNINTQSELITNVFFFLDCHKVEIVEALFAHADDGYKSEWYARDPFSFWCNLDLGNREAVIRLAQKQYAPAAGRVEALIK